MTTNNGVNAVSRARWPRALLLSFLLVVSSGCGDGAARSADDYYGKGAAHCAAGKWRACEIELKNALKVDANHVAARGLLGQAYLNQGKINEAAIAFEKALQLGGQTPAIELGLARARILAKDYSQALEGLGALDYAETPDRVAMYLARGDAFLGLRQARQALQAYGEAARMDPAEVDAKVGMARAAIEMGDHKQAHRMLDLALAADAGHTLAAFTKGQLLIREAKPGEAEAHFRRLLEGRSEGRLRVHETLVSLALGESLLKQEKYAQVKELLSPLIAEQPNNYIAKYLVAAAEHRLGNLRESERLLREALAQEPSHKPSIYLYGLVNYALGNVEQAEEYLSKVVDELGATAPGRKLLAMTELRLGKFEELLQTVSPSLEGAGDEVIWPLLAARAAMGMGRLDHGKSILEQAIRKQPEDIQLRVQLSQLHLQNGEHEQALAELRSLTAKHPDIDATVYLLLFRAEVQARQYDAAQQTLLSMRRRAADTTYIDYLQAHLHAVRGDVDGARNKFSQLIRSNPDYAAAYHALATLEDQSGNRGKALATLNALLAQSPDNMLAMLHLAHLHAADGAAARAKTWIDKAQSADPKSAMPQLALARLLASEQRLGEATDAVKRALVIQPDDPRALELLARLDSAQGRHADAIRSLKKLSARPDNRTGIQLLMVREYIALGEFANARKSLAPLRERHPDNTMLQIMQFEVELGEGNHAGALQLAKSVAAKTPDSAQGPWLLARYHASRQEWREAVRYYRSVYEAAPSVTRLLPYTGALIQAGNASQAVTLLEQSRAKEPDNVEVLFRLGQIYQSQGLEKLAAERYEAVLTTAPRHAPALNNLAWLYMQTQPVRARALAEQAIAAQDLPEFRDTLGWILMEQNVDLKRAINLLQSAVSERPDNAEIRWHYALALHRSGLTQQAIAQLERLLKSNKDFEQKREADELLRKLKSTVSGIDRARSVPDAGAVAG